jgi:SAM-dependent methyltransferase
MKQLIDFLSQDSSREFVADIQRQFPLTMNATEKLIRSNPDKPIRELLTLFRLRQKAIKRIPEAEQLVFTEKGVMQSSSTVLGKYHAMLFADYSSVADLCCGCGIDLMHLAKDKAKVIAVDLDQDSLLSAEFNCRTVGCNQVEFRQIPAEEFAEDVDAVFADPDRRPDAKRRNSPESISPPLSSLLDIQKRITNMAIKLSPILDYQTLALPDPATLQFVSEEGTLKEILLCLGELALPQVKRIAVQLPSGLTFAETGNSVSVQGIKQYLYEPDPAVIRAGLVQDLGAELDCTLIDSYLALLSADQYIENPWVKAFRVKEIMPYNKKQLQRYLTENNIGDLVIKPRGFPEETEDFKKKLKLKGNKKALMFILRMGDKHRIVFCEVE